MGVLDAGLIAIFFFLLKAINNCYINEVLCTMLKYNLSNMILFDKYKVKFTTKKIYFRSYFHY